MAVLGLAYVMNLTGMTTTLGRWVAGSGDVLRLPVTDSRMAGSGDHRLGHLVQRAVRRAAGGGREGGGPVRGPAGVGQQLGRRARQDDLAQNLAIAAAAVGMAGKEGDIFRRVLFWSVALTLVMCVLVYLQSTSVLSWMVV